MRGQNHYPFPGWWFGYSWKIYFSLWPFWQDLIHIIRTKSQKGGRGVIPVIAPSSSHVSSKPIVLTTCKGCDCPVVPVSDNNPDVNCCYQLGMPRDEHPDLASNSSGPKMNRWASWSQPMPVIMTTLSKVQRLCWLSALYVVRPCPNALSGPWATQLKLWW